MEFSKTEMETRAHASALPSYMIPGLMRYLVDRVEPGDFLMAVLENDLRRACERADDVNRATLANYVQFLYNYAPSPAWGSKEKVRAWLQPVRASA